MSPEPDELDELPLDFDDVDLDFDDVDLVEAVPRSRPRPMELKLPPIAPLDDDFDSGRGRIGKADYCTFSTCNAPS